MKEGEIVQNDTYENLLKDGGEFANLLSIDEDKEKGDE
jgi:ABC-type multidrug transport system fused ATPase/permease subunit